MTYIEKKPTFIGHLAIYIMIQKMSKQKALLKMTPQWYYTMQHGLRTTVLNELEGIEL